MKLEKVRSKPKTNWYNLTCTVIALLSFALLVVFWFTNVFQDLVISALVLRNGTTAFQWWQRPLVRALYKIRVFNYTNVADFEAGKIDKLTIEELGPYNYRETLQRVNIEIHDNGTLTYQEKRSFQWEGGRPDDENIVIPNVPLLATVAFTRDMNFFSQMGVTALLSTMGATPFITVTTGGFLWGYNDKMFEMAKPFLLFQQDIPDKFGMLAFKNGVSKDRITIHDGTQDVNQLGVIERINGLESRNVWDDPKCDKIDGTDGTMFPPYLILQRDATLNAYMKDMCTLVKLQFVGEGTAHGLPTLRYKPTEELFDYPQGKDSCYCPKMSHNSQSGRICPPKGTFNTSTCNFGAPTLVSMPHFYNGDASLQHHVEGLKPDQDLHETYLDIHPRLSVPIGGVSRFQVNLEVRKALGVPFAGNLKDGAILPLFWVEMVIDEMPEPVLNALHHAYYTTVYIECAFKWGSLISIIASATALLLALRKKRKHHKTLQRNVSGQNPLLDENII